MKSLVDVVIPCRNDLEFLHAAVRSVANQTLLPNACFVIDDGSTEPIQASDFTNLGQLNVQVIRLPGLGVSCARNKGIENCNSKYVAFLDADDIWLPNKLAKQVRILETHPQFSACFMGCVIINPQTSKERILLPAFRSVSTGKIISEEVIVTGSASSIVCRREILDKIGGFNDELHYAEDLDMWLRLSLEAPIYGIQEVGVVINENPNSVQRRISVADQADLALRTKPLILGDYLSFEAEIRTQMIKTLSRSLAVNLSRIAKFKNDLKELKASQVGKMVFRKKRVTTIIVIFHASKILVTNYVVKYFHNPKK